MTKEEFIDALEAFLANHDEIATAGRVEGESAIGVEFNDGNEFFIEIQEA